MEGICDTSSFEEYGYDDNSEQSYSDTYGSAAELTPDRYFLYVIFFCAHPQIPLMKMPRISLAMTAATARAMKKNPVFLTVLTGTLPATSPV